MERRLILDAVRRDGMQLGSTEEKYKDDPDIVFAAVTQNGEALQFASDKQRSNKQVVLAAVQQDGSALADVAPRSGLDDDPEICLAAVQNAPWALQYASDRVRQCTRVVTAAVSIDASALQYAMGDVLKSHEVVRAAASNNGFLALWHADASIQSNEAIVRSALGQNSLALGAASDKLCASKPLVLFAIEAAPRGLALMYADEALRDDKEVSDHNPPSFLPHLDRPPMLMPLRSLRSRVIADCAPRRPLRCGSF